MTGNHRDDKHEVRRGDGAASAGGYRMARPITRSDGSKGEDGQAYVLITGGAGFIGTNLADHLLRNGRQVVLLDNLSRGGVRENFNTLQQKHGQHVQLRQVDVRDADALRQAVRGATHVFHFAAQVAVTSSLVDPMFDFEVNARGTLNLLEAVRACPQPPRLLFTSTNKVYGELDTLQLRRRELRYERVEGGRPGIAEQSLKFCSPYGCSKGAADQYVLDYARTFQLPAVVLRMSCIYGPHQRGTEDQGWVAHFLINALNNRTITLFGDGRQVRDILFVDDLIHAMQLAMDHMPTTQGQAFNIGGGPDNTISLLELLDMIEQIHGTRPRVVFDQWRTADQRYYVSDTSRFERVTGWRPRVGVREGIERLYHWLRQRERLQTDEPIREDACPR